MTDYVVEPGYPDAGAYRFAIADVNGDVAALCRDETMAATIASVLNRQHVETLRFAIGYEGFQDLVLGRVVKLEHPESPGKVDLILQDIGYAQMRRMIAAGEAVMEQTQILTYSCTRCPKAFQWKAQDGIPPNVCGSCAGNLRDAENAARANLEART